LKQWNVIQSARIWQTLGRHELAEACYGTSSTDLLHILKDNGNEVHDGVGIKQLVYSCVVARMKNAWESHQDALAHNLEGQAAQLAVELISANDHIPPMTVVPGILNLVHLFIQRAKAQSYSAVVAENECCGADSSDTRTEASCHVSDGINLMDKCVDLLASIQPYLHLSTVSMRRVAEDHFKVLLCFLRSIVT
jgi:hypothetical protein